MERSKISARRVRPVAPVPFGQAWAIGLWTAAMLNPSALLWSQSTPAVPVTERDPYAETATDASVRRPFVIYGRHNIPQTPKGEDLPLRESVSQYGITWTFEKPVRVGQFINGDWYVVGPVTIKMVDPMPLYGRDIPERELDHMDKERPENQRVRHGFMLNPPARMKVAYDIWRG